LKCAFYGARNNLRRFNKDVWNVTCCKSAGHVGYGTTWRKIRASIQSETLEKYTLRIIFTV